MRWKWRVGGRWPGQSQLYICRNSCWNGCRNGSGGARTARTARTARQDRAGSIYVGTAAGTAWESQDSQGGRDGAGQDRAVRRPGGAPGVLLGIPRGPLWRPGYDSLYMVGQEAWRCSWATPIVIPSNSFSAPIVIPSKVIPFRVVGGLLFGHGQHCRRPDF